MNAAGTTTLLNAPLQQLQVQPVYQPMAGAPYGQLAYFPTQDFSGGLQPVQDTVLYQDASGLYATASGATSNAKVIQAAGVKGGPRPQWLPKVNSNGVVGDLLDTNPHGQINSNAGGNLVQVVDADGKVYYYNPEN
mmetsp:Transcript_5036/g.10920  ORF Transcript_5036/g.10920 Transcript_5036/m.10920 type:complete len:136 (-) Transcript_5036:2226-2633(-)